MTHPGHLYCGHCASNHSTLAAQCHCACHDPARWNRPDHRDPIDQDWCKTYVDTLLACAERMPMGAMRDAALLRADHAMDLVRAWRERK